jgi:hypothetical protein
MGFKSSEAKLVFFWVSWTRCTDRAGRNEGGCGVRKEDLCCNSFRFGVLNAFGTFPIQWRFKGSMTYPPFNRLGGVDLGPRVVVRAGPRVKPLVITALQVRLVVQKICATMTVSGDYNIFFITIGLCVVHLMPPLEIERWSG